MTPLDCAESDATCWPSLEANITDVFREHAVGGNLTMDFSQFWRLRPRRRRGSDGSGLPTIAEVQSLEPRLVLAVFAVGPDQEFASLAAVPWETLGAGDTVQVHWRETPYHEKILISSSGTAARPLMVVGVPGPQGERPVIDGDGATTRTQTAYSYSDTQNRGLLIVSRDATDLYGFKPSFIQIVGLEFRNAHEDYSFTDEQGHARQYTQNAAAIFVERGEHITIRDCRIRDSANGLFVASSDDEASLSRDILVDANIFEGNGNVGSSREHHIYTEASGIVFQNNRLGELRSGSQGIGLKDRSAGTVIRYNVFAGGSRLLDLVDSEGSFAVMSKEPNFRRTVVYGNVFLNDPEDAATLIHYGGDSGVTSGYRKGLLHFYHNTVIVRADQEQRYNTRLFELSTNEESVDARNNLVFVTSTTPGAVPTTLSLMTSFGKATLGTNWLSDGWQISAAYGGFLGTVSGVSSQLTNLANEPGLIDFTHGDLRPALNATVLDRAGSLHKDVAKLFPIARQVAAEFMGEARVLRGSKADLGAFESNGGNAVAPSVPAPAFSPNGSLRLDQLSYSVREGGGKLTITVHRIGGTSGSVSVDYETSADSAQAGGDFRSASGRLTFRDREIKKTFSISLVKDKVAEPTESFGVRLFNVTGGATLASEGAVIWLHDDEAATFQFTRSAATVNESSGGLDLELIRLGDLRATVSVTITAVSQTARSGVDFDPPTEPITFNPGEMFASLWIGIDDDSIRELAKSFQLQLKTLSRGTALGAWHRAAIEILDDDL